MSTVAMVPNGIETLPTVFNRLSRAHERYRRQTDGRVMRYSEREGEFTFANDTPMTTHTSQSKPEIEFQ